MEILRVRVLPPEFHLCARDGGTVGIARATPASRFGDMAVVAFLAAQALDGILTYVGVRSFGPGIEANPIIAWLMAVLGQGPGLAAAKIAAASLGIALHLSEVHRAVAVLAAFYLAVAVVPWMAVLFLWSA